MLFRNATMAALLLVTIAAKNSSAGVLALDLTSGVRTTERSTGLSYTDFDTYRESGFQVQVESLGNHMDSGYFEGINFHNGPANDVSDNDLLLTFSGGNFSLLGFSYGSFSVFSSDLTFTGSNGFSVTVSAAGGPVSFHCRFQMLAL